MYNLKKKIIFKVHSYVHSICNNFLNNVHDLYIECKQFFNSAHATFKFFLIMYTILYNQYTQFY